MDRVFSHESLAQVTHFRNLLEQAGVACTIKNEKLLGGLGEIPFLECSPELWVLKSEDISRARLLIDEVLKNPRNPTPWNCKHCSEINEGQFAACWKCGAADEY